MELNYSSNTFKAHFMPIFAAVKTSLVSYQTNTCKLYIMVFPNKHFAGTTNATQKKNIISIPQSCSTKMLFWQFLEYINIRDVRIFVLKISGSVRSDFFRAFLSVGVFNWRNLVLTFSKIVCVEFNIKKRVLPVLIENIL